MIPILPRRSPWRVPALLTKALLTAAVLTGGLWAGAGFVSNAAARTVPGQAPAGCTGTPSDTWIDVAVEGVANSNGLIAITLYADNPRKFLVRHGSLYVGRVPAQTGTTVGCIFVPRPGVYALAIYHDENASQTFDRTGLGLPAEAYGFSNNPSTLAGLPAFRGVRLAIPSSGLLTRIRLKYP